jgi:hypothetical protein
MNLTKLAAERLHELLDYDPDTGVFTWLEKRGRVRAGDVAGTLTDDGVYIRVDGRRYSASQLAHLWITNEWPHDHMNHRDGIHASALCGTSAELGSCFWVPPPARTNRGSESRKAMLVKDCA